MTMNPKKIDIPISGMSCAACVAKIEKTLNGLDGVKVELLGISQGRVSNHLACLKWCGYVSARQDERDGRYIYYQVTDPRVREIVKLGWEMMSDNTEQIARCTRIQAK